MKCPFCRKGDFAVIDSRSRQGSFPIRRRRCCTRCHRRVWTVETTQEAPLQVIKKDQSREPFDREKIRRGLEKACYKRPVSMEQINAVVDRVEEEIYGQWCDEVAAPRIGELVMEQLQDLDKVAFVRFASVYREFQDVSDFMQAVQPMLPDKSSNARRGRSRRGRVTLTEGGPQSAPGMD